MILSNNHLTELSEVAIGAAKKAAQIISHFAAKGFQVHKKEGMEGLASQVLTEADLKSQEAILDILAPTLREYDLGLLAEESDDDKSRYSKDYFWAIDPMDGTLAFSEKQPGYSVSIALVSKEGVPYIGVVANPLTGVIYSAVRGMGFFVDRKEMGRSDFPLSGDTFTLVMDSGFLKHPNYETVMSFFEHKILEWGFIKLNTLSTGGAVMNAMWVLENSPSCYFKFPKESQGGGSIWDFAASACIYHELGAVACDFEGKPLHLNPEGSFYMNQSGVIYCNDVSVGEEIMSLHRSFR